MTKFIIVATVAAIFGLNSLIPADCHTDNGKRMDHCQVIDGKEVFTK